MRHLFDCVRGLMRHPKYFLKVDELLSDFSSVNCGIKIQTEANRCRIMIQGITVLLNIGEFWVSPEIRPYIHSVSSFVRPFVRPGKFEVCFKQVEAVEKIDLDEKPIDPK